MKRRQPEKDRTLVDNGRLLRAWKKFHRDERDAVLAGPHARTLEGLFQAFSAIEHVAPVQLIGFINAINWSAVDHQTRCITLHELSTAIVRLREKRGLPPFDDPLWGAPPNAFQVIQKIITEFPASPQERPARRGPYPEADHE